MKKIAFFGFLSVAAFIVLMIGKTALLESRQMDVPKATRERVHIDGAAKRLSTAIALQTISLENQDQFTALVQFITEVYPRVHNALEREIVNQHGLLYTWEGGDTGLSPVILMAHTDVVPVAPDTAGDWSNPPFSGKIDDEFIWGRGTLDCKGSVFAILEAVESLLRQGFKPERTVYLAFGHDEEVGGENGAAEIARRLKKKNIKAEWILDEGGMIFVDGMAGILNPVALLGVAEKGYMTLKLSVKTQGGHSSMPPPETAIGILSKAVYTLEQRPFPAKFTGVVSDMFAFLAPEMPLAGRFVFANKWLFGAMIKRRLEKIPSMNAGLRTTIAPTVIYAGMKENVLPQNAEAIVNFRLYPGDSIEYVMDHVVRAIDDPRVIITQTTHTPSLASNVTPVDSESFKFLQKAIQQTFENAIVVPYLLNAGTDTKHYADISGNIFRFLPLKMGADDFGRIHGTNERLGLTAYDEMIYFYAQLIADSNKTNKTQNRSL